jgi:hypothetical protein
MSRGLLRLALLALAFALGTYAFGWWAVPAVAFVWGVVSGTDRRVAVRAGVSAAVAWVLVLLVQALLRAPILAFGDKLAGAMQVPVWALWAVEVAFPLLAGWSAALLGSALRGPRSTRDSAATAQ